MRCRRGGAPAGHRETALSYYASLSLFALSWRACWGRRMRGELFLFSSEHRLSASQTDCASDSCSVLVFVGGLGDGLLACAYLQPLSQALSAAGWALVQPLLRSSYSGWGAASLATDAQDLHELLSCLRTRGVTRVVMMGHSTGCQDTITLLRGGAQVSGAILQAPVSDREYLATLPETAGLLELAERMVAAGQGEAWMPRQAGGTATTASRFLSLAGAGGDDDLFSSDLSDAQLSELLGHVRVPTLLLLSGEDEYVPASVDSRALAHRLERAMAAAPFIEARRIARACTAQSSLTASSAGVCVGGCQACPGEHWACAGAHRRRDGFPEQARWARWKLTCSPRRCVSRVRKRTGDSRAKSAVLSDPRTSQSPSSNCTALAGWWRLAYEGGHELSSLRVPT